MAPTGAGSGNTTAPPTFTVLQPASTAITSSKAEREKMCTTFEVDKSIRFPTPPPKEQQTWASGRYGVMEMDKKSKKEKNKKGKKNKKGEETPPAEPEKPPVPPKKKRNFWTEQETRDLLHGCRAYGIGNWTKVLEDPAYSFNNRKAIDLKDRYRVCFPEEYKSYAKSKSTKNQDTKSPKKTAEESLGWSAANWVGKGIKKELGLEDYDLQKVDRKEKVFFTAEEDAELLRAFRKYGPEWKKIQKDKSFEFDPSRRNTDLRDRFRIAYPALYNVAMDKRYRKKAPRNKERMRQSTSNSVSEVESKTGSDHGSENESDNDSADVEQIFAFEDLCADTGVTWTSYDDMVNEMANFDGYDFFSYHASLLDEVDRGDANDGNDDVGEDNDDSGDEEGSESEPDEAVVDPRLVLLQTPSVASGTSFTPSRLFSRRTPMSDAGDEGTEETQPEAAMDANILMGDFLWDNMAAVPFFELDSSIGSPFQTMHMPPSEATNHGSDEDEEDVSAEPSANAVDAIGAMLNENTIPKVADAASVVSASSPEQPVQRSKSFVLKKSGRSKVPKPGNLAHPNSSPKRPVGRPRKFIQAQVPLAPGTKRLAIKQKTFPAAQSGQGSPTSISTTTHGQFKRPVGRPPKGLLPKRMTVDAVAGTKRPKGRPRKDGGTSSPKKRKVQEAAT